MVDSSLIRRQSSHLFDSSSVSTTVEVVIYSSAIVLVLVRATNEAIRIASITSIYIQVGSYTTILNVLQRHRLSTQAVLGCFSRFACFVFSDERFSAFVAVQSNRLGAFDFAVCSTIGICQVVTTEDTGRSVVVIFPLILIFVPVEFLTQSRETATYANQTISCSCAVGHVSRSCRCVCFITHTTSTGELVFESSFRSSPPYQLIPITSTFGFRISKGNNGFGYRISRSRGRIPSVNIEVFTIYVFTGSFNTTIFFLPLYRINDRTQISTSRSSQVSVLPSSRCICSNSSNWCCLFALASSSIHLTILENICTCDCNTLNFTSLGINVIRNISSRTIIKMFAISVVCTNLVQTS